MAAIGVRKTAEQLMAQRRRREARKAGAEAGVGRMSLQELREHAHELYATLRERDMEIVYLKNAIRRWRSTAAEGS